MKKNITSSAGKKSKPAKPDGTEYSCRAAIGLIGDYLAGSVTRDVRDALERHLGLCPDCAAFLATYRKTIEETRRFLRSQAFHGGAAGLQLRSSRKHSFSAIASWLHLWFFIMHLMVV